MEEDTLMETIRALATELHYRENGTDDEQAAFRAVYDEAKIKKIASYLNMMAQSVADDTGQ